MPIILGCHAHAELPNNDLMVSSWPTIVRKFTVSVLYYITALSYRLATARISFLLAESDPFNQLIVIYYCMQYSIMMKLHDGTYCVIYAASKTT